jgi:hypothetical protein
MRCLRERNSRAVKEPNNRVVLCNKVFLYPFVIHPFKMWKIWLPYYINFLYIAQVYWNIHTVHMSCNFLEVLVLLTFATFAQLQFVLQPHWRFSVKMTICINFRLALKLLSMFTWRTLDANIYSYVGFWHLMFAIRILTIAFFLAGRMRSWVWA